jgi:hypothetical protein
MYTEVTPISPVIIGLDPIIQKFSGRYDNGVSDDWIPAFAVHYDCDRKYFALRLKNDT